MHIAWMLELGMLLPRCTLVPAFTCLNSMIQAACSLCVTGTTGLSKPNLFGSDRRYRFDRQGYWRVFAREKGQEILVRVSKLSLTHRRLPFFRQFAQLALLLDDRNRNACQIQTGLVCLDQ